MFRRARFQSVGILFLLFFTVASAWAHTLSGTVYGGDNPLPNATITLTNVGAGTNVGSVLTDAAGNYSFDVDDGEYRISCEAPAGSGFGTSLVNGIIVSGRDVIQDVALLDASYAYAGVLRLPDGSPVVNAEMRFSKFDGSSYVHLVTERTAADGTVSVALPAGTYSIRAQVYMTNNLAEGIGSYWYDTNFVRDLVVAGDVSQELVLPFVRVSGQTTDANGMAVGNVLIGILGTYSGTGTGNAYFNASGTNDSYAVASDAQGNFAFWVPSYDDYMLSLKPPAESAFGLTTEDGVDFSTNTTRNFVLATPHTYTGVLRLPDGSPVVNAEMRFSKFDGSSYVHLVTERTAADGTVSVALPAGTYSIRAQVYMTNNLAEGIGSYWYDTNFVRDLVVAGDVSQELVLPFVRVSGQTTDANGMAVGNVLIGILGTYSGTGTGNAYFNASGTNDSYAVASDAQGNFAFWVPSYDDYMLSLKPPAESAFGLTTEDGVDFSTNTTRNFVLATPHTYTGVLRLPDGSPVVNAEMRFSKFDGSSYVHLVTERTAADGTVSVALPAGTYSIRAQVYMTNNLAEGIGSYWYDTNFVRDLVVAGDVSQELVLPFVRVSGQTTDANGVAVGNVLVGILGTYSGTGTGNAYFNASGTNDSYAVASDAQGNFAFWVPSYDDYTLVITPPPSSGFGLNTVSRIDFSTGRLLNIILPFDDMVDPLVIAGPYVSGITSNTALVSWATDEPATSTVSINGSTYTVDGYRREHSVAVDGLAPSTNYTAAVESTDESGNGPATGSVGFVTANTPDFQAPLIIEGPIVTEISHEGAIVEWRTNEPGTTDLDYGLGDSLTITINEPGLRETHRVVLSGLTSATVYSLQAYTTDSAGNGPVESPLESFTTLPAPDVSAPVIISGPMVVDLTDSEATIVWRTDEPAVSGLSLNDGIAYKVIRDEDLATLHEVRVTGLTPETLYEYTVSATDAAGNGPTLSETKTFETSPWADTLEPVITEALKIVGITHQSAVVHWRTDESADSVIVFGTAPDQLDRSATKAKLKQKHVVQLTGLDRDTVYYLRALSTDSSGNTVETELVSFTSRDLPDHAKPVYTMPPTVVGATDTTATIAWETDEPADSVVEYGRGSSTNLRASDGAKKTRHSVTVTGLTPGEGHSFKLSCKDTHGNKARFSSELAATASNPADTAGSVAGTLWRLVGVSQAVAEGEGPSTGIYTNELPDTEAPLISQGPSIEYLTDNLALVVWATSEVADAEVVFGPAGMPMNRVAGELELGFEHVIVLTNLDPNTVYDFQVHSRDVAGNQVSSTIDSFATDAATNPPPFSVEWPVSASEMLNEGGVTVTANTTEYGTCQVDYGLSAESLDRKQGAVGLKTLHTLSLTGLMRNATYYYAVACEDLSGQIATSEIQTFDFGQVSRESLAIQQEIVRESRKRDAIAGFRAQQVDAEWAGRIAPAINEALAGEDARGISIRALDCRSHSCEMHWTIDEGLTNLEKFEHENEILAQMAKLGLRSVDYLDAASVGEYRAVFRASQSVPPTRAE